MNTIESGLYNKNWLLFAPTPFVKKENRMTDETYRPHRDEVASLTWEIVKSEIRMVNRRTASLYSFEFIQHETTRAFADIDLKYTDLSEEDFNRIKSNLFDTMKKNSRTEDFVVTDGSYYTLEQSKISAHIIFRNRYIKKKTFRLKSIPGQKLIDRVIRGVDDYDTIAAAFDQQVYGKMCWLRFPYGIAHDKINIHYPVDKNISPADYMVSLLPKGDVFVENQEEEEEEKPKKKRKDKEEFEKELDKRMSVDIALALIDCLNVKKRANSGYDSWFRLACVLYNTLPYDIGYDKFLEMSASSDYENFDEKSCDTLFSSLSPREDALGDRTLVRWAKEDNAFKASIVLRDEEKYKIDMVITSNTHIPRVKEIVAWLNNPLLNVVRDSKSKSIYVRENNTWVLYNDKVKRLEAYFPSLPFTIGAPTKDSELKVMSNDGRWMRQNVWQYVESYLPEFDIEKEFITSTYLKLCFKNGVYDFVKKSFTPWEANNNVFSAVCIDYDYKPATKEQAYTAKAILEGILGADVDNHLRRFSQMIAGFVGKLFNISKAGRDSGRTQITGVLKELFCDYVQSFSANSFTVSSQGNTTEASLQMGFMIPIRWCRIAASSEIQVRPGILLDSPKIKMACGGDPINARAVHGKHTTAFTHNISIVLMANEFPPASESDVYGSIYQLEFPYTFISAEEYKEAGYEENPNPFIKKRVDNFAKTLFPVHRYGLLACIINAFSLERCMVEQLDMNGDIKTDESEVLLVDKVFNNLLFAHFKKNENSEIPAKIYQDFLTNHSELLLSKTKKEVQSKLKLLGKEDNNVKLLDDHGNVIKNEKGVIKRGRGFKGIEFIKHPSECSLCREQENIPE